MRAMKAGVFAYLRGSRNATKNQRTDLQRTTRAAMASQPTRIAYVTGGMGGIGTAICRGLWKGGHTVIAGFGPGSPPKDPWLAEMPAGGCNIHPPQAHVPAWDAANRASATPRA